MQRYWIMKSEPDAYSIDDLKRDKTGVWDGVRNFQARNYMREMRPGDLFLFYHSSVVPPGVAGVGKIAKAANPDPSQFDPKSPYFDRRATTDKPIWDAVAVRYVKKLPSLVLLDALRAQKSLAEMKLLQKGSRLSVLPITKAQFQAILEMARQDK